MSRHGDKGGVRLRTLDDISGCLFGRHLVKKIYNKIDIIFGSFRFSLIDSVVLTQHVL